MDMRTTFLQFKTVKCTSFVHIFFLSFWIEIDAEEYVEYTYIYLEQYFEGAEAISFSINTVDAENECRNWCIIKIFDQ